MSLDMLRCRACQIDPDPRGWSACYECREINMRRVLPIEILQDVAGLYRAIEDHVAAIRRGDEHDVALTELALRGGIAAYLRPNGPDLSDAHVDRVARRLCRAFDDANRGKETPRDVAVLTQSAYHWRALAREAIQLGAIAEEES